MSKHQIRIIQQLVQVINKKCQLNPTAKITPKKLEHLTKDSNYQRQRNLDFGQFAFFL